MNILKEKARIKNAIDKVDNPEILGRISAILSDSEDTLLTDDQLTMVRERREAYFKDTSLLISLDEFKANIKSKYGF